ncbi:hypothetical protein [Caudoviricetes sp.]|nr:hypothetical protein [Caudoviricetes sp.]
MARDSPTTVRLAVRRVVTEASRCGIAALLLDSRRF